MPAFASMVASTTRALPPADACTRTRGGSDGPTFPVMLTLGDVTLAGGGSMVTAGSGGW